MYPGCRVPLGESGIGELAHIVSKKQGNPRYDPTLADESATDNLLLLCPTHHRMIDADPEKYTVETLRRWNNMTKFNTIPWSFDAKDLFTVVRLILQII
jgi:hypothetical protein